MVFADFEKSSFRCAEASAMAQIADNRQLLRGRQFPLPPPHYPRVHLLQSRGYHWSGDRVSAGAGLAASRNRRGRRCVVRWHGRSPISLPTLWKRTGSSTSSRGGQAPRISQALQTPPSASQLQSPATEGWVNLPTDTDHASRLTVSYVWTSKAWHET